MKFRRQVSKRGDGSVSQSALGQAEAGTNYLGPMRGVVIKVFHVDENFLTPIELPAVEPSRSNPTGFVVNKAPYQLTHGTYCSVFVMSSRIRGSGIVMPFVLIHGTGGLHDGDVWVPKESSIRIDGIPLAAALTNVSLDQLDGDHVMVDFQDGSPYMPYVAGPATHPNQDFDADNFDRRGRRPLNTTRADGSVRFRKHKGSWEGFDKNGNHTVDTRRAHNGLLSARGREPTSTTEPREPDDLPLPPTGSGAQRHYLRYGQEFLIDLTNDAAGDPASAGSQETPATQHMRLKFNQSGLDIRINETGDASTTGLRLKVDGGGVTIDLGGQQLFVLAGNGADAIGRLGNAAQAVALASHLETLYTELLAQLEALRVAFNAHGHGGGGTSPPVPAFPANWPTWKPAIASTAFKVPK